MKNIISTYYLTFNCNIHINVSYELIIGQGYIIVCIGLCSFINVFSKCDFE
jgi:hypothetical protein